MFFENFWNGWQHQQQHGARGERGWRWGEKRKRFGWILLLVRISLNASQLNLYRCLCAKSAHRSSFAWSFRASFFSFFLEFLLSSVCCFVFGSFSCPYWIACMSSVRRTVLLFFVVADAAAARMFYQQFNVRRQHKIIRCIRFWLSIPFLQFSYTRLDLQCARGTVSFFLSFAHFQRHRAQSLFLLFPNECSLCLSLLPSLTRFHFALECEIISSYFCMFFDSPFLTYVFSLLVTLVLSIIYHVIFAVMSCACKLVLSFFSADRCHLFMFCFRSFFPVLCSVRTFVRSVACHRIVLIPHVAIIK